MLVRNLGVQVLDDIDALLLGRVRVEVIPICVFFLVIVVIVVVSVVATGLRGHRLPRIVPGVQVHGIHRLLLNFHLIQHRVQAADKPRQFHRPATVTCRVVVPVVSQGLPVRKRVASFGCDEVAVVELGLLPLCCRGLELRKLGLQAFKHLALGLHFRDRVLQLLRLRIGACEPIVSHNSISLGTISNGIRYVYGRTNLLTETTS